MFKQEIIIPGNVIAKKNSRRIFKGTSLPSKAYVKWEKQAIQEMMFKRTPSWPGPFPCELHCFFYRETKRGFDYSNMVESVQDCLVKAKILPDDLFTLVVPVIEGMDIDKVHPRVFVTITPPSKIYNHGV